MRKSPFSVTLTPPAGQSVGSLELMFQPEGSGMLPAHSLITIEYDHIPTQLRFPEPSVSRTGQN
ncbi:MAG: hypothetical protein R3B47_18155 [Bacteroidia bacterium]